MLLENKYFELYGKRVFELVVIGPPFTKANHMSNEACFLHVIKGHATTISETERVTLKSQESMLMKCGNYISRIIPSDSNSKYYSFAVHFHPEVLEKIYDRELPVYLRPSNNFSPNSFAKVEQRKLIDHFIDGIKLYFDNPGLMNKDLLSLKIKEFILLLHQGEESDSIKQIMASLFSPETHSLRQIVDSHLYTDISVQELATLCNMSMSTFKREFKKVFTGSPASYLKSRKLERAYELLSISDKRITDVVMDVGFNDISHFSKSFTKKYGKSPSEYQVNQMN